MYLSALPLGAASTLRGKIPTIPTISLLVAVTAAGVATQAAPNPSRFGTADVQATLADAAEVEAILDELAVDPWFRAQAAIYDAEMWRATPRLGRSRDDIVGLVGQATTILASQEGGEGPPGAKKLQAFADLRGAILSASRATGVSAAYLWRTAQRESGLDPFAASKASSARGLFQFVEQTWLATLWRHGRRHGIGVAAHIERKRDGSFAIDDLRRSRVLALRYDPLVAARMAADLANDNRRAMEQRLGRPVSEADLYVAHVLGQSDALRLMAAASQHPRVVAALLLPRAAHANAGLFHHRDRPLTSRQLLERLRYG